MAEFEQRENSGTLFKNDKKFSANSPDYSGTLNVEGEVYRIAGWIKTARNGNKFLSIAISLPENSKSRYRDNSDDDDFDDDMPF